jgi:hypothetical protein
MQPLYHENPQTFGDGVLSSRVRLDNGGVRSSLVRIDSMLRGAQKMRHNMPQ